MMRSLGRKNASTPLRGTLAWVCDRSSRKAHVPEPPIRVLGACCSEKRVTEETPEGNLKRGASKSIADGKPQKATTQLRIPRWSAD